MEWFQAALDRYKQEQPHTAATPRPTRTPVLRKVSGPIVYTRTRCLQVPEPVLREHRIVAGSEGGVVVDAFKILRTQVIHRLKEKNWNVIGVTSPGDGEGKTFTAVNLAVSLGMDVTRSVLLVDANFRRPAVERLFDLGAGPGLADYILDDAPLEDLLIHPGIGRVVLLPAGRPLPHSTEALTAPRMLALVEELKHRYPSRIILFDLPSLLPTSDVLAFSPHLDALLLVVQEGQTKVESVEQSLALIKQSAPVLGTVINRVGYGSATPTSMKAML